MIKHGNGNSSRVSILTIVILFLIGLSAQTEWTHVTDEPVLGYGISGDWDDGAVFMPAVIKDGDTLRMWYSGADDNLLSGTGQIGYAYSLDGVSWHRFENNPVLPLGLEWEGTFIGECTVIKDDDTLKMWYGAGSAPTSAVGYATSTDGINWERSTVPVLLTGPGGDWDDTNMAPYSYKSGQCIYNVVLGRYGCISLFHYSNWDGHFYGWYKLDKV